MTDLSFPELDMPVAEIVAKYVLAERERLEAVWSERCTMLLNSKNLWMEKHKEESERREYDNHVLAEAWGIVKPNEESEYDTNNFYDRLRDLVAERERCERC